MSISSLSTSVNSGISNARGYLDNQANTILRPKSAQGISGFLFDVQDTESITLSADITDHYTESGSFINDHRVIKPIIINLSGFIGELVYEGESGIAGALQSLNNRLEVVDAYLGDKTPGAVQEAQRAVQQAQQAVSTINQTIDKVQNVVGLFEGISDAPTAQEKAFSELEALFKSGEFVTVQTPWKYYENMTIQSVTFTQNGETKEITDISVTLKELRVSETKTVDFDENEFTAREQVQSAPEEDQGLARGNDVDQSFLFAAFGG